VAFSHDGRTVVAAQYHSISAVRFYEVDTGKLRFSVEMSLNFPTVVRFSPDDKFVAVPSDASVRLVPVVPPAPQGVRGDLTPRQCAALWEDLGLEADGTKPFQAMVRLFGAPGQAVALIQKRLRPVTPVAAEHIERLLADLDSDRFAVRHRASAELEKLEDLAEPALRKALAGQPSLEVRRRVEHLLAKLDAPLTGERLRAYRAIEVLEKIGTAEAQRLLRTLASGPPGWRTAAEARQALKRLAKSAGGATH
jgi:hypothetical protein